MLIIELVSGKEVFKFNTASDILLYINEDQYIPVIIAKVLGMKFFYVQVGKEKKKIDEVRVVYKHDSNVQKMIKIV